MGASTVTRLRRVGSVLLVAEALLVVAPALVVSNFFVGSQILGKSIAFVRIADVTAQGLGWIASALLVLLLLLAAWRVGWGNRGIGALVLQPAVLAMGLIPSLRPMGTLHHVSVGWLITTLLALTTTGVLIASLRHPSTSAPSRWWWWIVAFGVGVTLVAAIGATSRALPADPLAAVLSGGQGRAPLSGIPETPPPPQNPQLAANPWNSIHNDSWGTDSYWFDGPRQPAGAPVESLFTGGDCATITFDSRGRLVTLCNTLTRVVAYVVDPSTLTVLAQQEVAERTPNLTDFAGGGYFVLDSRDRIIFPAGGTTLRVLDTGGPSPSITEAAAIPVADTLLPDEKVTSVLPDWSPAADPTASDQPDRYWYVGSRGTVGIAGGDAAPRAINLGGETIENSFAVTRDGIYVVTGAALYRLEATRDEPPAVTWRTEYDAGSRRKPGQTSRASGTTPTVFAAGRLVAITDNADPQMNVVVARTDTGAVTCRQPVFSAETSATENALIAAGNTLVVENNYGYAPAVMTTVAGGSVEAGLSAVRVDPRTGSCELQWQNEEIRIPSVVSKASLTQNVVLTYSKPVQIMGTDGWYFTAVDLATGAPSWTRLAGAGVSFNNHYAAAYLGPGGDFFVGTLNGLVVLRATATEGP